LLLGVVVVAGPAAGHGRAAGAATSAPVAPLQQAARQDELAWPRLATLCDRIGARPAGSPAFAEAVRWAMETMRADGHARVWREPVTVHRWVRGREHAMTTAPYERELPVLALGGSVPARDVEGAVAVRAAAKDVGPDVQGKIVLFAPEIPEAATAGERYGFFGRARSEGVAAAGRQGALAVLVASTPERSLATPHTGSLHYETDGPRVPAAALTAEDAAWIARLAGSGVEVRVRLDLPTRDLGMVETSNVLAEIPGTGNPEEVVVVGAHLDSWDVGQGAHDDGVGVIHVIEVLRLLRGLPAAPRRTVRGLLFANEEFGLDGGKAYAAAHGSEPHLAAVESDMGGFRPHHWGVAATEAQIAWLRPLALSSGVPVQNGGGGADISPLADRGVPRIGLYGEPDRYFDVHHTRADTLDKVSPDELRQGIAALAALVWELANAPGPPLPPS